MQQTGNSAKSGFISWAGRFRNIGLVGSAMAVLIGFIEAVSVHASEATSDDVAAHDHAAQSSSGVLASAGEDAARQLSHGGSEYQDAVDQLAASGAAFEGAAHQLGNSGAAFEDTAHQFSSNGAPFEEAANYYQLSDSGSAPGDTTSGHAHDAALSASLSSINSNDDNSSGSALANSDSFWFNADGPVHLSTDADQSLHAATDSFAVVSDEFADHSAPNTEVTFTSAESSSFQYSGPSILDTAPGGASAHWSDAIDAGSNSISLTNFAAGASELSEIHQASSIANIQNNVFAIGGGSLKSDAGAGLAQILEAWNGDLGTGYTSAGAATGGTSGSVPGGISAGNGQGLVINVVYDSSVASAPAGFTQTIANVVNFYESQFSTPATITIDVGYGEIDGQSVVPGALGESQAYMTSVSYAQLETALVNNANAIGDTAAAASLSATSPVSGQYWIPTAEAQALGLAGGGIDGYAGFTNIPFLDYNVGNDSGTVPGSQYDFFGVVAHEFSEIMGRQMLDGANFAGAAGFTALDLFHYSAPGVADFSGTTPGYFSPDGGFTNLGNFNTNPGGDFGDWAASVGNNSYLAYSNPGALDPVTASDITVMNLLGWDSASSSPSSSPPSSSPPSSGPGSSGPAPVVTAPPAAGYDSQGAAISFSAASGVLAQASDSAGNALSVSAVDGSPANVGTGVAGNFGVLTLNADGSYAYVNNNPGGVSAEGGVAEDTFNYTVSDSQGSMANSTLTVLVTSPSDTLITGPTNTTIEAGRGLAVLDAGAGDMTAVAGSGHQWLFGGPGDTLWGANTGKDTFMFAPNFGHETIQTFKSSDVIEFPTSLFANFHQIEDSIQTIGSHTVITYDATDAITLTHITSAQLHAHNFSFIV